MKNTHTAFFVTIVITLSVFANLFFYQKSFAFLGFGGQIPPAGATVTPILTCTNGLLLTIGPPSAGLFLLPPTAKIYPVFDIIPTVFTLGLYIPGGVCSLGPVEIPAKGTILFLGVSPPSLSP